MKTFILQLERHDDIISVRDKMGWAKNSRILIIWPEEGEILNRRLDLILLQRHGRLLGSPIALITKDPDIRYFAPRMGIPVYKSTRHAQNQSWRVPYRFRKNLPAVTAVDSFPFEQSRPHTIPVRPVVEINQLTPVRRAAFFAAGILALLALGAVLAPRAELYLTPKTLVQDVLIDAYTGPDIEKVNLAGSVPSELIIEVVEGRDSEPVSGTVILPDRAAEGIAHFSNLTDHEVEIPKGLVVRPANGGSLRYATIEKIVVPAGPGKTAAAAVRCLTPGKTGDLPATSLAILEGVYSTQLSVSNPEPISGGSDRLEPAPTSENRAAVAARLHAALSEAALQEIQRRLAPGDLLIPSSLELVETLEEHYQPDGQKPADLLSLSTRLKFQARVVRGTDLEKLTQSVFDANLTEGYVPVQGSLHVEVIEEQSTAISSLPAWKLHAVRRVQAQISESKAIQLSMGLAPNKAITRLQTMLPLEEPPLITLQPAWWPRMPVLPFRIQVVFPDPYQQAEKMPVVQLFGKMQVVDFFLPFQLTTIILLNREFAGT